LAFHSGREADHSPPSQPRSKNGWSSTSTSPVRLHGVVLRGSTGTTLPFISLCTYIRNQNHSTLFISFSRGPCIWGTQSESWNVI
jgi:hypothetical protein